MKTIVCIKAVPESTEVQMNPRTKTIMRTGMQAIVNPYDTFALEQALQLRDQIGGEVAALSMGVPTTLSLLQEVLALGIDDAMLLTDRAFAGSDSLATAKALSLAIKHSGHFDLIVCGKQSSDGDTAQVGPELAEMLGIPYVTYVQGIETCQDGYLRVKRLTDHGYERVEVRLPALITVIKGDTVPRLPSLQSYLNSCEKEVKRWDAQTVGADPAQVGLNGSPTQVVRIFVPSYHKETEILEGAPWAQADALIERLQAKSLLIRGDN